MAIANQNCLGEFLTLLFTRCANFLTNASAFSHLDQSRRSKGKAHYQAKLLH